MRIDNSKDALINEYRETEELVRGLSPKLELHKKLTAKLKELEQRIGEKPPSKKNWDEFKKGKKTFYTSKYNP